jgi:hypothetical protein
VLNTCVKVFANGTVVHVCQLTESVPQSVWSEYACDQEALPAVAG